MIDFQLTDREATELQKFLEKLRDLLPSDPPDLEFFEHTELERVTYFLQSLMLQIMSQKEHRARKRRRAGKRKLAHG